MKKSWLKAGFRLALAGVVIAIGVAIYLFNMPHRNVVEAKADASLSVTDLTNEYLTDAQKANLKYLDSEGDSKILEISGTVVKIDDDLAGNKVVLLRNEGDKTGVSCTFTKETNSKVATISVGKTVKIKGVIRSGASFDADMQLYQNAVVEKCDLISE